MRWSTGSTLPWVCAFVAAPLAACLLAGCGASFAPDASSGGGKNARPLAAIYDIMVTVPALVLPQFAATGLTVDLTVEIDPDLAGPSGPFEASVSVQEVRAGGVVRPFQAASPMAAFGTASGDDWALDSIGPIEVGSASTGFTVVMLSLTGVLAADGRSIEGIAVATSSGETGSFFAVKQRRYLVAATDFGLTGTASLIRVRYDTRFQVERDLETVSGDPVARATGRGVHVVNRFVFDNIQSLDPASGFRTALQFSTGNGSNPHDIVAVDSNRLYISRYEAPFNDVLIADAATGASLGFVDLSGLATNGSGTPRADGMAMAAGLVFVGLQNIDASFQEYGPGRVAAIDPATDSLDATITLSGLNPFGPPATHPVTGHLYWAAAGIFQGGLPRELSGGIEVIDPVTRTTLGLLVDDDELGGNVSSVALAQSGGTVLGYCVVTFPSGANAIRSFDAATGAVAPGVVYQSSSLLPEVIWDGDGYLLVPERDVNDPRLVVLDAATGRFVAAPRLSLPPFSVAVLTRGFVRN